MSINYDYSANMHTVEGASAAWQKIFSEASPASVLDVGCGFGTWLKAAMDAGVTDIFGIDGVQMPKDRLLIPVDKFSCQDFTKPVDLRRRFDVIICLEVAEHLDSVFAPVLIDTLVKHSNKVYFSAACPGQTGQHHVNCQWPSYWQQLFNERGYVCEDNLRWQIWHDTKIEPWYRQNMFLARYEPEIAGREPRIRAVIHPDIWKLVINSPQLPTFEEHIYEIEQGRMPVIWNLVMPARALWAKLMRRLK